MPQHEDTSDRAPFAEIERGIAAASPTDLPHILAELERLKAAAWAALVQPARAPAAVAGPSDDLMTRQQAAQLLGVSVSWLKNRRGRLPFEHPIGNRTPRYSRQEVERWIRSRRGRG